MQTLESRIVSVQKWIDMLFLGFPWLSLKKETCTHIQLIWYEGVSRKNAIQNILRKTDTSQSCDKNKRSRTRWHTPSHFPLRKTQTHATTKSLVSIVRHHSVLLFTQALMYWKFATKQKQKITCKTTNLCNANFYIYNFIMTVPQNVSKLGDDRVMILYWFVGGTLANSADTRCYGPLPAHAGYTPTTRAITRCSNLRGGALARCSHAAGTLRERTAWSLLDCYLITTWSLLGRLITAFGANAADQQQI
jgi:hypothetical protein